MKKNLLFLFVILLTSSVNAQNKLVILNPSFEENKPTNSNYPGYAPPPWGIASVAFFSGGSCSIGPTPDMNPGISFLNLPIPDDKLFAMGTYSGAPFSCKGGEAFYQKLCRPMLQGVQYSFNIRVICNSSTDSAVFGVYGSNAPPPASSQYSNPEIFYTAKIASTTWTTYTVTFTPNATCDHLIIGGYDKFGTGFSSPYISFDNITEVDSVCQSITVPSRTICKGACDTITPILEGYTKPYTITWSDGYSDTTLKAHQVCPTATTTYTVTVADGSTTSSATATVTVVIPNVVASNDVTICLSDSTQLNATGALTYSWSPSTYLSNPNISNPFAKPTSAGIFDYVVTGTTALGCVDKDTVRVTVINPVPTADIGPDRFICPQLGDTAITLTATGGNLFTWSTGATTPSIVVRPTETTIYSVIVGNSCGTATASDEIKITVRCGVEIPNVITPNNDPDNQYFYIKGLEGFPGSRLEIYDRWGLKMYESDNYDNDWDGKNYYQNKGEVSDGVYYYILYLSDKDKTVYTGFVQVIRGK